MNRDKRGLPSKENAVLLLNRGKKGLVQIAFGRTGIVILLLALQVLVLYAIFFRLLGRNTVLLYTGGSAIASIMALAVVNNHHQNPSIKLTWVVLILAVPIFAIPLYFFVNMEMGHRLAHHRHEEIKAKTAPLSKQDQTALSQLPGGSQELASYMWDQGDFPVCRNTAATYYPLGDDVFQELLDQLEKAEHFIFLEYFIIEEGYMWGRILRILEQKVQEGVEVRVLYDGTCAVALLPYSYPKQLEAIGIRCKMFAPLRPLVSTHYNNRDHRKILVIDGKVAFTGGINLADEYINRKVRYGHWKDNAILIRGEAVRSFTLMFLQMWNTECWKLEDCAPYLKVFPAEGQGLYIPYGSCPYDSERLAEMVYMDLIDRARRYVHIMTPYLVIDNEMATALTFAAKRGVDVSLILPHIPDKKYMFALAKTYYPQLLEAGVRIFEYTPGFVHSKLLVSDGCRAVVGTINFDYRSLYLHFECGVYMEDAPAVNQVEQDFLDTLTKCQEATLAQWKSRSLGSRLTGYVLRLFAPLL